MQRKGNVELVQLMSVYVGMEDRGIWFQFPAEQGVFLYSTVFGPPPGRIGGGTTVAREAYHSPASSAEVKNTWH
jgi:hypothetical protein